MRALILALAVAGVGACRKPTMSVDAGMTVEVNPAPSPTLRPNIKPSVPMPGDWPSDVPIYPGAHISKAETKGTGVDAGVVRTLDFETADEQKTVVDFYYTVFRRAKKVFDMDVSMAHGLQFELGDETIDISVMAAMGLTQVTVSVRR